MKKGQLESGELIFVVMIVLVIFIVGLAIYSSLKAKGIEESQQELTSLSAVDLAQEAAAMQEIACGYNPEIGGQCIDLYRLNAFKNFIDNLVFNSEKYNYYRGKLGSAQIIVERIYPNYRKWMIYNNTPLRPGSQIPLRVPVYLYDPITKQNSFGVISVVRYS